jgi:hypothetical protein
MHQSHSHFHTQQELISLPALKRFALIFFFPKSKASIDGMFFDDQIILLNRALQEKRGIGVEKNDAPEEAPMVMRHASMKPPMPGGKTLSTICLLPPSAGQPIDRAHVTKNSTKEYQNHPSVELNLFYHPPSSMLFFCHGPVNGIDRGGHETNLDG